MAESTVTKSSVFKEDMSLATGGTAAEETGSRRTSTGGTVSLTKLDASHLKFQTVAKSLEDLVDGGKDVTLKPLNIDAGGTLAVAGATTLSALTPAGYVKNSVAGLLSTGAIAAADLPTAIDAAKIANGSVSNTEFQYIGGLTSDAQTQLSAKVPASQADQETGTEATKYVTPAIQKYHPSAAKAWVMVTGGGTPAVGAGFNVASITDGGQGIFTVVFTVAFSSAVYGVAGIACRESTQDFLVQIGAAPEAGQCNFYTTNSGSSAEGDISYWSVVFFGDQA